MNSGDIQEKQLALRKKLLENPAIVVLGVENIKFNDDSSVEIPLLITKDHTNIHGMVHGGVFVTLLDTAMGYSCYHGANKPCVTLDINTSFISNCKPGEVVTTYGNLVHVGKKIIVTEGKIVDRNGKIMVVGQGTFFVLQD